MATEPPDPGMLHNLVTWAGIGITGMFSFIFKHVIGEVRDLKENSITREDFKQHSDQDEKVQQQIREELRLSRENQAKIFDKIEAVTATLNERHITLLTAINQRNGRSNDDHH